MKNRLALITITAIAALSLQSCYYSFPVQPREAVDYSLPMEECNDPHGHRSYDEINILNNNNEYHERGARKRFEQLEDETIMIEF